MKKTPKKKSNSKLKSQYEVIELPSNNKDMENFVVENREEINRQITESIDYALNNHLTGIEVFRFKGSNFVVMLHRKDFKESLENIFDFSMNNQQFELCIRAKKLIEKSDRLGFVAKYKYKK